MLFSAFKGLIPAFQKHDTGGIPMCGCNNQPTRPMPRSTVPAMKPAPKRPATTAVKIREGDKFCKVCGWALKKSVHTNSANNSTTTKVSCTNRMCSNYFA
jgi:hypothetical protein